MKAACFAGVERVEVLERPQPQLQADTDAIVKVSTAGLCGSDLHVYHGRETGMDMHTVMGHELVGEIIELGNSAGSELQIGDRVATPFTTSCGNCYFCQRGLTCRCERGKLFGWVANGCGLEGAQAEYVRIEQAAGTLVKMPAGISDEIALLLGDNLSTGFFAADCADVKQGDICAVIGCGTVGLLSILAAKERGASIVFGVDPVHDRRQLARQLGATVVSPSEAPAAIEQASSGRGADAILELVGLPDAQRLAYQLIRPGGRMSIVGCHSNEHFAFSPVEAYDKNLAVRTGRCPARHYMPQLVEFATRNHKLLESLVTHRFTIDEATEAYRVFSTRSDGCIKAVLKFPAER